jgi:hypothetical protein
MATLTSVFLVKFIGEDFNFLPTSRAFTKERFQIFELFKAWTMSRDTHFNLLFQTTDHERQTVNLKQWLKILLPDEQASP